MDMPAGRIFEVGDIVMHEDGRVMTVRDVANARALCVWFEEARRIEGEFRFADLQLLAGTRGTSS